MDASLQDSTCDQKKVSKGIEDELQNYHQKDLMVSHVYRVGMKIFGKKPPIRRRIINCSTLSWNTTEIPKASRITQRQPPHDIIQPVTTSTVTPGDPSYDQYRAWITERRQMRQTLDSIGAHEQWLSSKDCTPIEATLLRKLREEREQRRRDRLKPPPTPTESSDSDGDELTPAELKRLKHKERYQLLKDIRRLQKFLKICRTRIAELVVPYDTQKHYLIPAELLYDFLERILPPSLLFEGTVVLCEALEKETGKEGFIDYRKLFNDDLDELVLKYLQENDKMADVQVQTDDSVMSLNNGGSTERSFDGSVSTTTQTAFSTMNGEMGEQVIEVKNNAQKQFDTLIEYCLQNNIVLDKKLAKRALLIPPDKTRQQCLERLRQPGTDLLSRKTFEPSRDDDKVIQKQTVYTYGWQYQQVRGPLKPKLMRLSTGTIRVKAKTDTWLTYSEFEELTKELQSRPGFNYKYHGLPSNSAFWPGALQDKLRLYLPHETLKTKPYSLYNIFQPIDNPKINQVTSLLPSEKGTVWPENDSGHVQLGSSLARTRKTFIA